MSHRFLWLRDTALLLNDIDGVASSIPQFKCKTVKWEYLRGWDGWMASLTRWIWVWVGDGQGGLACCSPWGCKESDMTEWLNWTEWLNILKKQTKSLAYLDFFLYYSFSAYHWRYWWYKFWKCNDSFLLTIYFEGQMTIRTSR